MQHGQLHSSNRLATRSCPYWQVLYPQEKPVGSVPCFPVIFSSTGSVHAYLAGGSKVLEDVSISAKPGEYVAIVGESGAGKTTLFRLLLGLEKPDSGAVYYDGRDLSQMDFGVVRRQMGVVMQDSSLRPGSVLENIIGTDNDLTEDDAWRALEHVGVAEEIRTMPMGLHTTVGENSANFSGGQSQRIRMAAALVYNPRIIFLDEPTSWLDTKSQSLAMKGIEDCHQYPAGYCSPPVHDPDGKSDLCVASGAIGADRKLRRIACGRWKVP